MNIVVIKTETTTIIIIIITIIKTFLNLEDSLDLSISVLVFPFYGVRSDDSGKPIVEYDLH